MTAEMTAATSPQKQRTFWPALGDFFVHVLGQIRILKKLYPGIMHFLIFWGMTIQLIGTAIELVQIQLFIPFLELGDIFPVGRAYLYFELVMDLAGIAILVGVLMAAFRRVVLRPSSLNTRWDDTYALLLLAFVPLIGFTTEALRFVVTSPEWAQWSPAGNLLAGLLRGWGVTAQTATQIHAVMYWAHIVTGLIFVASIPFTKLRHLVTAPLNILFRSRREKGALPPIHNIEEAEILGATQAQELPSQHLMSLDACLNCGRCEEVCPATASGMTLSPRNVVQSMRTAMVETLIKPNGKSSEPLLTEFVASDDIWQCTTCAACIDACPVFVNPVANAIEMRRAGALMTGDVPASAGLALRNIERQNNPWGLPAADRTSWAEGQDIRVLQPGESTDVLLFVGCAFSYDDRNKQSSAAFIRLLKTSGVDFAILGDEEACCGETARRLGNEYIFQVLAEQNIETFSHYKFDRIVTQCPHCFNTLKNEYPQFGGDFKVQHYTEFLAEHDFTFEANGHETAPRVTYQDSCYLGRYNNIFNQPRSLLTQAGAIQIEMANMKANGFCCGGGGGQMWMETDADTRINNTRLTQAIDTGADIVATACPYCTLMLDDAIRTMGVGEQIVVKDVAEILADHLAH